MFSIISLILFLFSLAFTVLYFVFWIWMLIDCLKYEPSEGNDKIIWAVVIILLQALGALLYYIVRRPERIKQTGQ
ncbi:hypothetical protein F1728_15390 [Gimesia benthica]|uniref:Cardiolipin synthase N-terminal domain-containing protein n=1 Tax=Gimesia benthica TaxID=2608982 RepID=A0A6I6AEN5_9PLAN|nr:MULTISPECIES: PLDc N-terminal domain-containing protein [Gimesia]KAA0141010.1 hypothetical protein FYZ48_06975 [Gimesia chilikensis]QGQ23980.1 hypothetical protein F1728_15390 [Gimesia benthica]